MKALSTERVHLLPLSTAMMRKRLEIDDFELVCELPDGPRTVRFGPQWPGDAVAIFPMMLGIAGDDGEVDLTYVVIDRETGEAVGQVGTKESISDDGVVEIGYGMNEAIWGQGLGTEAVGALVDELLSRPEVATVTAETATSNVGSQKVLGNNAFTRRGEGWNEDEGTLILWAVNASG